MMTPDDALDWAHEWHKQRKQLVALASDMRLDARHPDHPTSKQIDSAIAEAADDIIAACCRLEILARKASRAQAVKLAADQAAHDAAVKEAHA